MIRHIKAWHTTVFEQWLGWKGADWRVSLYTFNCSPCKLDEVVGFLPIEMRREKMIQENGASKIGCVLIFQ